MASTRATGPNVTTGQKQNELLGYLTYAAKTSAYTLVGTDDVINCTSGTFTLTLPAASTLSGNKIFWIKNSGTGIITVAPNGAETIDGQTTIVINQQYASVTLLSTGTGWIII